MDAEVFVKSILASMWMLNDLPREMRKDLHSQLGLIWVLLSEPKCFPSLTFTEPQQKAICQALEACSDRDRENDFPFTYEALLKYAERKKKETSGEEEVVLVQSSEDDC